MRERKFQALLVMLAATPAMITAMALIATFVRGC